MAPGNVRVEGESKAVQHIDGGTIRAVLVEDGDLVRAGDPLILLDETEARAALAIQEVALVRAWARAARLRAERDEAGEVHFSPDLVALAEETGSGHLLDGERRLFAARQSRLTGQLEILEEQAAQLARKVEGLQAQERAQTEQLSIVRRQLAKYNKLRANQFISEPELLKTQAEVARLAGERGEYIADIAETRKGIGERRLEMLQLRREFAAGVEDELREAESAVLDARERVAAARHTFNNLRIAAPASGYVVNNVVRGPGQVIAHGERLMEIVPHEINLIVEAKVAQQDIEQVATGQEADIRFSSLDTRNTPVLRGTVAYVSADLVQAEDGSEAWFVARVPLEQEELQKLDGYRLRVGMAAEVFIRTGGRTVLDFLLKPVTDHLARAFRER